ncbi:hypothetical protein D9757_007820 [Collybiopsis confluens]|uniref:TERF2-interacting telomeric protein 1 Myb domain-containing protein n=1 Tax=Collybiopsis confluens TaxID=2823264 RepID=A0A8H5MB69_9AGAR|nr:hypothetical protein D9757_007820 [Collybiopsis confluens]
MSKTREAFTTEDDQHLAEYLAQFSGGRMGKSIYQDLVSQPDKWPWGTRHTKDSWRSRYRYHYENFDQKISKYLKQKAGNEPISPMSPIGKKSTRKANRSRAGRVEKNNLEPRRQVFDQLDTQPTITPEAIQSISFVSETVQSTSFVSETTQSTSVSETAQSNSIVSKEFEPSACSLPSLATLSVETSAQTELSDGGHDGANEPSPHSSDNTMTESTEMGKELGSHLEDAKGPMIAKMERIVSLATSPHSRSIMEIFSKRYVGEYF